MVKISQLSVSEIIGSLCTDEAARIYMRTTGMDMLWSCTIIQKMEDDKLLGMLQSEDLEMISLAYTIIKEKYDKGEENRKIPNS